MKQMPIINFGQIIITGNDHYNNGDFIPIFLDELFWLAVKLCDTTLRVLVYLLSQTDKNNQVTIDIEDMMECLAIKKTSAYKSISTLKTMQILCKAKESKKKYKISLCVINPRLAYRGNTRKINKHLAPVILEPNGKFELIPKDFEQNYEF